MTKQTGAADVRFVWDAENILVELDGSGGGGGATRAVYTLLPQQYGELLSQRRFDGGVWTAACSHADVLGSTDTLTDPAQVATDQYTYDGGVAFSRLIRKPIRAAPSGVALTKSNAWLCATGSASASGRDFPPALFEMGRRVTC